MRRIDKKRREQCEMSREFKQCKEARVAFISGIVCEWFSGKWDTIELYLVIATTFSPLDFNWLAMAFIDWTTCWKHCHIKYARLNESRSRASQFMTCLFFDLNQTMQTRERTSNSPRIKWNSQFSHIPALQNDFHFCAGRRCLQSNLHFESWCSVWIGAR